jgi:toxin-antitoxin system PIN domain toxin
VIAVDTNILVYAHRQDSPFHSVAKPCVTRLAEGSGDWALPWPCIHEFLAVVTHPRAFQTPTTLADAVGQVEAWLDSPNLVLLSESTGYWLALRSILTKNRISGPRVHDARIAALCLQHAVQELWSADRDFSRFPELKVVNPLKP